MDELSLLFSSTKILELHVNQYFHQMNPSLPKHRPLGDSTVLHDLNPYRFLCQVIAELPVLAFFDFLKTFWRSCDIIKSSTAANISCWQDHVIGLKALKQLLNDSVRRGFFFPQLYIYFFFFQKKWIPNCSCLCQDAWQVLMHALRIEMQMSNGSMWTLHTAIYWWKTYAMSEGFTLVSLHRNGNKSPQRFRSRG